MLEVGSEVCVISLLLFLSLLLAHVEGPSTRTSRVRDLTDSGACEKKADVQEGIPLPFPWGLHQPPVGTSTPVATTQAAWQCWAA